MRVFAIILDVMLLAVLGSVVAMYGWPQEERQISILVVAFAAPLASTIALTRMDKLFLSKIPPITLLSLWFRRKAAEEKARIRELERGERDSEGNNKPGS